ncbi:hypothetical protein Q9189_004150 [Teloschistes chrysophthalmus]
MGDGRSNRVGSALSALIQTLIPPLTNEDDASLDERRDDALALATSIIDEPGSNGHQSDNASLPRNSIELPKPTLSPHKASSRALEDAFSVNGLRQLPTREARLSPRRETIASRDRRYQPRSETSIPPPEIHPEVHPEVVTDAVMDTRPTEASLLHDLPFTLQGLSSTHLPFSSRTTLDLPPNLPLPVLSLLHKLAEPSLLYRVLSDFVDSHDEGLVAQSLRAAIGLELRSYLGLIATLEGEIRRAIATVNPNEPRGGIGKAGVTLKRCVVWTRDATMGLRLMSSMAEAAKSEYTESKRSFLLTSSR